MSRRGEGVCPVCRRRLVVSVGGWMLRHKHRVTKAWCSGRGREALPVDSGFEETE